MRGGRQRDTVARDIYFYQAASRQFDGQLVPAASMICWHRVELPHTCCTTQPCPVAAAASITARNSITRIVPPVVGPRELAAIETQTDIQRFRVSGLCRTSTLVMASNTTPYAIFRSPCWGVGSKLLRPCPERFATQVRHPGDHTTHTHNAKNFETKLRTVS